MPRSALLTGALILSLLAAPLAVPATAQAPARPTAPAPARPAVAAAGPRAVGTFGAWTAALHTENGARVCYMLARANREGSPPNAPTLTVSHRTGARDQVAFQGEGLRFQRNAAGTLKVGDNDLALYTHGDTAYARDNRAAIQAMRGGREAVARLPGPNGRGTASETFPLNGFSAAYEAIGRECPAPRR
ncbi:invasion associated locus B family protein [Humitalea sp. 24SJ18S-53]|uniref:invasion associated locus B family protein n=1 Tax=Humitalea sp. 24SJ18S-53 TaxID=3422307 RepID=UPI003D6706DC